MLLPGVAGRGLAWKCPQVAYFPYIFAALNKNLFLEHLESYFLENALARPPVPLFTGLGGKPFPPKPVGISKINLLQARLRNRFAAMFLYGRLGAVCHSTLRLRL